jgi:hypothetical protein
MVFENHQKLQENGPTKKKVEGKKRDQEERKNVEEKRRPFHVNACDYVEK